MSLREEIQLIVARIDEDHINHEDETMLIINKVLDAAYAAADKEMSYLDDSISKTDKSLVLDAINKLRSEK